MKLLFLHGPPAAGKLTVAKAIAGLTPARILDNHAVIDVAKTVFDFGAPGFWELVQKVRAETLRSAVTHGVPLLISTSCYSHPQDYPAFADLEALVTGHGGTLLPVYLDCDLSQLRERVGNQDRVEKGKVTSAEGLDKFLGDWSISAVPRENCLRLRSDKQSPPETARMILAHFGLN